LAVAGATLYAGGDFAVLGGAARARLGALSTTNGSVTAWNPGADNTVESLVMPAAGTPVYAGGTFGTAGGAARHALAALSPATGLATAWNPGPSGGVRATPDDPLCVDAVHTLSLSADAATVYAG